MIDKRLAAITLFADIDAPFSQYFLILAICSNFTRNLAGLRINGRFPL